MISTDNRNWIITALMWLTIAGILGVVLRVSFITDTGVNYRNLLHAHSHLAFLGWVFTGIAALIIRSFVDDEKLRGKFRLQYWMFFLSNAAMIVSFILNGYNTSSIVFSSIHMAATFWFASTVWGNLDRKTGGVPETILKSGFIFLFLSALGPLSLPVISKVYTKQSHLYQDALHYYLHLQIYGWFTFALLAIFLKRIEQVSGTRYAKDHVFILSLVILTLSSLPLSIQPGNGNFNLYIGMTSAGLGFFILWKIYNKVRNVMLISDRTDRILYTSITSAFILKSVALGLSGMDTIGNMLSDRDVIIGFLHLYLIGVITLLIILLGKKMYLITVSGSTITLILACFIITEAIIFLRGIAGLRGKEASIILAATSLVLCLSIINLFREQFKTKSIRITKPIIAKYDTRNHY